MTHTHGEGPPIGNAYDKYATRNPIERRLMAGFLGTLDSFLPHSAPNRVLEVGVGEGEVLARVRHHFPSSDVVGLDLPDSGLAADWERSGLAAVFGDGMQLPFPDATFDLVLAIEVLEHVAEPERALREIARVAADSVVLSVPREPIWRVANLLRGKYVRALGNTPGHVNHWDRRSFERFVARDLTVTALASPFPWTVVKARVAHPD